MSEAPTTGVLRLHAPSQLLVHRKVFIHHGPWIRQTNEGDCARYCFADGELSYIASIVDIQGDVALLYVCSEEGGKNRQ